MVRPLVVSNCLADVVTLSNFVSGVWILRLFFTDCLVELT